MSHIHSHPSQEELQRFLDGDVPARERRRIEEHVASCTRCTDELTTWSVLFEDLGALGGHRPGPDFHARVMAGVRVPATLPLAARVRGWLESFVLGSRPAHVPTGSLQDLADGALTGREAARVRAHLEICTACAGELQTWSGVMARLSGLERFEPAEGFADGVMTGLSPVAARAAVRRAGWSRALAGAKRVLPRTRRAWAALAGASVTPAVTIGLVLYAVFSHPTLTPQALVSFAFWQVSDLVVAGWSAVLSGALTGARLAGLEGLLGFMAGAPLLTAVGLASYAVAFTVAVRILYKNLVDRRPTGPRYASASAS